MQKFLFSAQVSLGQHVSKNRGPPHIILDYHSTIVLAHDCFLEVIEVIEVIEVNKMID